MGMRMKTKSLLRNVGLFTSILLPASLQALDVHEWGTFTVLVSSRGQTVNWYQPYSDIAKLPGFVMMNYNAMLSMKSGIPAARVRMETPVIYFYPEEETTVSVRVAFANGSITERFPTTNDALYAPISMGLLNSAASITCVAVQPTTESIFNQRMREFSVSTSPTVVRWTGKLLPPNHEKAKSIPAVAPKQGENYAAARNVPDAWIFESDTPNKFAPSIPQVEKFIFYRGAGQSVPPYLVTMPDDHSVTFHNMSQSASSFQVALRVRDGQASWVQMPNISGPSTESSRSATITFPEKTISLEQADQELCALFLGELISRGLTKAEAQAMIDTWNHTWFAESGQRVFTIVDRTWVDSVLPLGITPEPKKLERVFVARYEVLSPAQEKQLGNLMATPVSTDNAGKFAALELGRFNNGAAEIVADNIKDKSLSIFRALAEELQKQASAK